MIIYCEKPGFGQIVSSFSLNSTTIRLKRPQNLSQTSFFSLQFPKSDRLLALADGESSFTVQELTSHTRTNIWVVEQFLGFCFRIEEMDSMYQIYCKGQNLAIS